MDVGVPSGSPGPPSPPLWTPLPSESVCFHFGQLTASVVFGGLASGYWNSHTWRTENFLPQPYTLSFTNWLLRTTGDLSDHGTGRRLHKEITSTLVTHPNKIIVQGRQMQIIICFDKYMLEKGNLSAEKIYILIELRFLPQGQLA